MTSTDASVPPPDRDAVVDPGLARYLANHPAPLVAADALIRDESDRVLIVDPVYKPGWDLPGGILGDEELLPGLLRELDEELRLGDVRTGRLLAIDSVSKEVYGRVLIANICAVHLCRPAVADNLLLQEKEIRAARFVPDAEALARFPGPLRRRFAAALEAERGSHTAHLRDGYPVPTDSRDHYAMLPAPMVSATALITDERGRVLVAEHSYRRDGNPYGLPGGMVLAHETPQQGAAREIAEELGLTDVPVGRLLGVDSAPARAHGRALDLHIFAVGPLTDQQIAAIRFPDGEIVGAHWLAPDKAVAWLPERVGRRVVAGLQALATGNIAHLTRGVPQVGSPVGIPPARRAELEKGGLRPADHVAMRPKALTASAVLITDRRGRVLIVKPTYHDDGRWLLPGGGVDSDAAETARQAAEREVSEELGLQLRIGQLLATDWIHRPPHPVAVIHVYDGGVLADEVFDAIRLPARELSEWRLVDQEELHGLLLDRVVPRVHACLAARACGTGAVELLNGRPVAESVVAIVHRGSGELLLHERDEHAHCWPEYWSLLGGRLEPGEVPHETLARELFEEAALRIGDSPQVVERLWDRQGSQPQLVTVYAVPYDGTVDDLVLGEGRQLRFVAPAELDAYRMPPYLRAVVDRWLAARSTSAEEGTR